MTKVMIELTDEELTQISGGHTVTKEIQYKDQTLKTSISFGLGWGYTAGKDDPGENPIFTNSKVAKQ